MTLYVACPPWFLWTSGCSRHSEPMPGMSNRVLLRWGLASSSSPLSCRKHLTPWLKSIGSLWVQTWILLGWIARCLSKLPPWIFYKNLVGQGACDAECPDGSVSDTGAADVWECACPWWGIDTDPALESFQCVDLSTLADTFLDTSTYAATAANVFLFSGSLQVVDASTEALLTEIHQRLSQFLDLTGALGASLNRSVRQDTGAFFSGFFTVELGPWAGRKIAQQVWRLALWGLDFVLTRKRLRFSAVGEPLRGGQFSTSVSGWSWFARGTSCDRFERLHVPSWQAACRFWSEWFGRWMCPLPTRQVQILCGRHSLCILPGWRRFAIDNTSRRCDLTLFLLLLRWIFCPGFCEWSFCMRACGLGFFCYGGGSRQACNESQTTVDEAATSITECLCAPGFLDAGSGACQACPAGKYKDFVGNAGCSDCAAGTFASEGQATCDECEAGRFATAGAGTCDPCPAGRYSLNPAATSLDSCVLCPIGTWGNTAAASLMSACVPCVSGSTTALPAADSEALCARPDAAQSKTCISGRTCAIDGIAGSSLQDGHRMATTSSACSDAKLAVSGIISSGISKAATQNGGSYEWGDVYTDFTPLGGVYNLCWCASMDILTCDNLNSNFVIAAGQLLVAGPFANQLECLRGSDCTDLAFSGYDLLATDQIAVRRDACGGSVAAQISISNVNGLGDLQASGTDWVLGFGVSTNDHDFHLYIDASNAGYFLCWCASERGSNTACATADFAVYAGRLRVTGPNVNQKSACAVGQECSVTGIRRG